MKSEDITGPVSSEEGRTVECSKCGAAKGEACRYLAGQWLNSRYSYTNPGSHESGRLMLANPGDLMPGVHPARKRAVRAYRLREYRREQAASRVLRQRGLSAEGYRARAAMQAWDQSEYAALAAWWREHGHIIANADRMRPDGSVRGRSYGVIDAEHEIDQAFER